jgi:N-acetylglucosaminyldiphosphoundecaprenol N-acetyl-beta-D-mannosaminyltransferase
METKRESTATALVSGVRLHSFPKEFILRNMNENIVQNRENRHISITNTESMYYAERIPEHLKYINDASFSLCDGIGAVITAKFQGKNIKRFNGPDFMLACCEYGQNLGWRHFFCGGKEGVADLLVNELKTRYPKIEISGTYCPPFRELTNKEEDDMLNLINESKPDIIWVGLGLLKQESWIAKYKNKLFIPWFVGVGAAFDFYAGTVRRAPMIFQKAGLEWLYRLSKEPRMLKRNMNSFVFMFQSIYNGIMNYSKNK